MSNTNTNSSKNKSFSSPITGETYPSRAEYHRKHDEDASGKRRSNAKEDLDKKFFDGELVMNNRADQIEVLMRHVGRVLEQRVAQWGNMYL